MPLSVFKDYTVTFQPGERIFSEGEKGAEFYVVQSGRVEIFKSVDGQRKPLTLMEKGDFFGELPVLLGVARPDSAEALERTEVIVINSTLFDQMIRSNIEIAVRIVRKLSLRLQETTDKLEAALRAGGATARRAAAASAPAAAPAPPAPAPARKAPAAGAYLEAEEAGQHFALDGDTLTIGRFDPVTGLKPEVDLSAVDIHRSVSRRHAKVQRVNGVYQISEEVGALNGTLVNNRRLVPGKSTPLKDGDILHFGMVRLTLRQGT